MELTKKAGLKMLKKKHYELTRKRRQNEIESLMDQAIDDGDHDRLMRLEFLRKRI